MTTKFLTTFAAAAVLAGAAIAQTAPVTQDPAQVEAGTYAIEPSHTRVMFSVDHFGTSTYYGEFAGTTGTLTLDPKNLGATTGEFHVAVGSVLTSNAKLDGELKADKFLDAGKFPQITYKITKVTPSGDRQATVEGEFSMHGFKKPLTLMATLHGAGLHPFSHKYMVGVDLTGKIVRSDFGVKMMAPLVSDDVSVTISALFEKQG